MEKNSQEPPQVTVNIEKTPFYKTASFWLIVIAIILLIIVGIFVFFSTANQALSITIIVVYVLGIILLIAGLLAALI